MAKSLERKLADCQICTHPNASEMNERLLGFGAKTVVAKELAAERGGREQTWYGRLTRHIKEHIPEQVNAALVEGRQENIARGQRVLQSIDYAMAVGMEALERTNDRAKEMSDSTDWKDRTAIAAAEGAVTKNLLAVAKIAEVAGVLDDKGNAVSRVELEVKVPGLESLYAELDDVRDRQRKAVKAGLIELPASSFEELEMAEEIEDAELVTSPNRGIEPINPEIGQM